MQATTDYCRLLASSINRSPLRAALRAARAALNIKMTSIIYPPIVKTISPPSSQGNNATSPTILPFSLIL